MPHLKKIVKYLPETEEPLEAGMREGGVMTWDEFMEAGKVRERERGGREREREGEEREREREREEGRERREGGREGGRERGREKERE